MRIWLLLLLLLLIGCSTIERQPPVSGDITAEELQQLESVSEKLRLQYQPDRSTYPTGKVQVREWVVDSQGREVEQRTVKSFSVSELMKDLCELPEDFWQVKYLMSSGRISQKTLAALDECYYTQPEWYGNDFVDIALGKYTNPDLEHWTPEGYGNYPHETILYSNAGEIHNIYTFFGASWIVEQYQGAGLGIVYPAAARDPDGTIISVDPQVSEKYLSASVTPSSVLLAPAYVLFEAPSDGNNGIDSCSAMDSACWRKKINLTVTVADNTPPGVYAIGFDIVPLDSYYRAKWADEFKERFAGGSLLLKPSQEMFKLTVIVG